MIWKNIVRTTASRRRFVATSLVYGLSLSVRFTSATGEEVEIPAQSLQRIRPVMSIMTGPGPRFPYDDGGANASHPIVLRAGWPLGPRPAARGCESSMPSVQSDLRH